MISLVNPHDVLFYPSKTFEESGYDASWLAGDMEVPPTNEEDLSTKPTVQEEFLRIFNLTGKPKSDVEKRGYLNFYGNLMRSSDNYLVEVLDKLEAQGLLDDTLIIRTSDHGEMGLSPRRPAAEELQLLRGDAESPADLLEPEDVPAARSPPTRWSPTSTCCRPWRASPARRARRARDWQGVDYSDVVLNPERGKDPQDYVAFTYDDFQSGQAHGPVPERAEPRDQHPREALEARQVRRHPDDREARTSRSKIPGHKPPQYEMYDLKTGPLRGSQPRLRGLRTHPRPRSANSCA